MEPISTKEFYTKKYEIRVKKRIHSHAYADKMKALRNVSKEEKKQKEDAKLQKRISKKKDERALRKMCPAERKAMERQKLNK